MKKKKKKFKRSNMRALLQRVTNASVSVQEKTVGEISGGFLVLLGIAHSDTEQEADWIVEKLLALRVFEDDAGHMNRSIRDVGGSLLIVSQFTLYGELKKGNRPSFIDAARPEHAQKLYQYVIDRCQGAGISTETGVFGAYMQVHLTNDGPVTFMLERECEG